MRELLAAPLRMTELLASQAVDFLKAPASIITGSESSLMRMTLAAVLKALERWTGMTLLRELSDFVAGFEHLVEGFRARAQAIDQALRAPDTSFAIVATPEPNTVAGDARLRSRAARRRLRGGRHHRQPRRTTSRRSAPSAGARAPAALRDKLVANYADFAALAARDRAALDAPASRRPARRCSPSLPVLEEAPASLAGLRRIAALLGADEAPRARSA